MSQIVRATEETGWRARQDRHPTAGQVVSVDTTSNTAILNISATDVNGNPVYLHDIPFSPQQPPQLGDHVIIDYGVPGDPHTAHISGMQVGSSQIGIPNSSQVISNGGVTSLSANGQPRARGDILLTGAGVSQSGNTFYISGGSGTPASTVQPVASPGAVGTSTNYAREDHVHEGVHSVNGQKGDVSLTTGTPSPLTTKGDLWGYSSTNARIPAGTDGQVLTADSTQPLGVKWAAPGGGGGASTPTWPVTVLSSSLTRYTAQDADTVIFCYTQTNALILTLPDPQGRQGKIYVIFNAYQGTSQGLTVATLSPGGGVVLGIANLTGTPVRQAVWYISDGANWHSFTNSMGN